MTAIFLKMLMLFGIMLLLGVVQLICFIVLWTLQLGPFKKARTYKCLNCRKDAAYIRSTPFTGDYHFCEEHAELEVDFMKDDPSHFYWYKINDKKDIDN